MGAAAVVEVDGAMLDEWEQDLDGVRGLIAPRFGRREPCEAAGDYVRGLLSDVSTRNGWTIAQQAGHATPDRMQKLLNRAVWDEAGVREDVRSYVVANPGTGAGCWCSTRPVTSSRAPRP